MLFRSFENLGVPNPVTASQPSVAANPVILHPSALPCVTSTKALFPFLYNQGFKKPRVGFPAAISASFNNDRMAAIVGVAALVPSTRRSVPFQMMV